MGAKGRKKMQKIRAKHRTGMIKNRTLSHRRSQFMNGFTKMYERQKTGREAAREHNLLWEMVFGS